MSDKGANRANREKWSGHLAFVLAAAASAVGLGNLWRFPASAAGHGGGVYILFYIAVTALVGVPLLITEISLGRATRLSPSRSFKRISPLWWFAGALAMLVPAIILPYYCVVGGWVTKYFVASLAGGAGEIDFGAWSADAVSVGAYSLAFALAVAVLIQLGVRRGIERSNLVMMPALVLLTIGIAAYVVCSPGSAAGLKYYLVPDFARLSTGTAAGTALALGKTCMAAMGQSFYSLSLAMGIMITYGSYVNKSDSIPRASVRIAFFDTFVALVAGMIIIPSAYAAGGEELACKSGAGLMFAALPKVFATMPAGVVIGAAFFTLVLFAALTSAISITETVTSSICDVTHWPRRKAAYATLAWTIVVGIPSVVSMKALEASDFLADIILMPICALLTCMFIGFVARPKLVMNEIGEKRPPVRKAYAIFIRYVAPIFIAVVFIAGILEHFGVVKV
ncbi:MAG: sodium-dependent transporter [Kiritimatiellae bacterium]|nr:sodium-dependent transporter [Kiritimatiellia bacterium]MBR4603959.1 sodium-dependent transporter [Kiritimatiellia bacterium]